jgi:heme-degrading monooxygenase HmoA
MTVWSTAMIARIGLAAVNSADLTIDSDLFRRERLNGLRGAPGCLDVFLLINSARDTIIVVSLWENDDQWESFAAQTVPLPFGLSASAFARYEVVLSAGSSSGAAARVHQADADPDHVPEVVHLFENVVMHAATSQHGFQGIVLVVDRERGHGFSISLWNSEADMQFSERSGYLEDQVSRVSGFLLAPPDVDVYTVFRTE